VTLASLASALAAATRLVLLILQLRYGLDEEMMAVLEAHWSPKVIFLLLMYVCVCGFNVCILFICVCVCVYVCVCTCGNVAGVADSAAALRGR